jgi:hypothetical protein
MARVAGAISIFPGAAVVAFSPNRWDRVLLDLPRGHGIHGHEVIGMALITIGVVLMWRASESSASG